MARNGAMFLDKLMMREQRNYQFDFLRKQHPLFSYFTKLVEQYSRILLPPKDLKNRLMEDVERPAAVSKMSEKWCMQDLGLLCVTFLILHHNDVICTA